MQYETTPLKTKKVKKPLNISEEVKKKQQRNINNMKTRAIVWYLFKRYQTEILTMAVAAQFTYILIKAFTDRSWNEINRQTARPNIPCHL
jgi:hypothetical protein